MNNILIFRIVDILMSSKKILEIINLEMMGINIYFLVIILNISGFNLLIKWYRRRID